MSNSLTRARAKAIIDWQREIGVTETIADKPVSRYEVGARKRPPPAASAAHPATSKPEEEFRPGAALLAAKCEDLQSLYHAIRDFDGCALRKSSCNTVVADGNPSAQIMIVGEAPGAEEDEVGRPFVGRSGRLMDEALAYVNLSRSASRPEGAVYISNVVFWRPPGNRNPTPEEVQLLLPFTLRHIALAKPKALLLLGNVACQSLLRASDGITNLRGQWREVRTGRQDVPVPAMPSFHPSFLLRNPRMKRFFWRDLLTLRERLDSEETGKETP